MSKPQKILFVEELRDEISGEDDGIPVPESHKRELDKRLKNHQKKRGDIITLKELQIRIEKRK